MSEGRGNCLKYLRRHWNRKEKRGNKDFKKKGGGGQAGSRGKYLKKRERGWNLLTNYGERSVEIIWALKVILDSNPIVLAMILHAVRQQKVSSWD